MQEFNKNILGHVHTTNNFLQKKCFPKQNGNERESYECFLLFINFHFYQIDCNMLYYVKLGLGVFLGEIIAAEVAIFSPSDAEHQFLIVRHHTVCLC